MLDRVTALVLTYNEAPNIRRTLERLAWARDIVIVDSGSTDETLEILRGFSRVRVFQRPFTTHAEQWNYGLEETGISTEWILALDADYVLSDELVGEIDRLDPSQAVGGYSVTFKYCINGRALRTAVYPPVVALIRKRDARYIQDGHTQRVRVQGVVLPLVSPIYHDDRKPLSNWFAAQRRYMRLEAGKLRATRFRDLAAQDRVRRLVVFAPAAMFLYCLVVRRGLLDGRAGLFYAFQRATAEAVLSFYLLKSEQ